MSLFELYLHLGFRHIADITAYDHILFIATLCGVYQLKNYKKVLVLVTAFTIGHSLTLALSTLNIVNVPSKPVEYLIVISIMLTALFNIVQKQSPVSKLLHQSKYLTALLFGLVHGLGFSTYLKELLGMAEQITLPLLAFNLGLELGQLIIVLAIMLVGYGCTTWLKQAKREWDMLVSGAGLGISFTLLIDLMVK